MTRLDFPSVNSEWQLTRAVFVYLTEIFFKQLKKFVERSVELTLLDKISVTLHVENCAFESLRFTAQAFRKVTIPLQLKMVTSNKKTCLVNGSNGNHSAVAKN